MNKSFSRLEFLGCDFHGSFFFFPLNVELYYRKHSGSLHLLQIEAFPSPCQSHKGIFLVFHKKNVVGFLEAEPMNVWVVPLSQCP